MRTTQQQQLAILRALRRNGLGVRILVTLAARGESTAYELARVTGSASDRVDRAVFGDDSTYRRAYALRRLGLVMVLTTSVGKVYRLTPLGRAWAARARAGLFDDEGTARIYRKRRR